MDLFTIENLFTLAMLTLLQAVLGLDNLLYIALVIAIYYSKKAINIHQEESKIRNL